ncbi:patatin-like phospholipase domain-containing protein 2 [Xyrauchen texanus]|uniref:patatin-like phospholipase domain-containing protein 2 n=1 Tax=Xyrauchen texanus TaxID=154827 RepID=UPI0022419149|nr:patatin-like phospholipase domain-containing protein 2 [Xyrauchen texanus]
MWKNMKESAKEWNISFAGCGFLMAYYCGVYCCLFERSRFLLEGVTKICGASSGALMGVILACQMSPTKCCENLLEMSREARKGTLGAVHPSVNLLKVVQNFLTRDLPDNAHILATGRLCVSLTRVSDGTNVLVSEFDSKEDLIQALVCSCFYPLYCGVIPPSYHGIRYVDGALSDNMPYASLRNTITISPFSGESDISPYGNPFYFHEIYYNNVSIHINFINAYRVVIAFLPPKPEVLADICQNGYKDAFIFLKENDILKVQSPLSELTLTNEWDHFPSSWRYVTEHKPTKDEDYYIASWSKVNKHAKNILPESIKKVFCKARMRENEEMRCTLSGQLSCFVKWCILPVEMAYLMLLRLAVWSPEMWSDLRWMCQMTSKVIRWVWKKAFSRSHLHAHKSPALHHNGFSSSDSTD